jgi:hypothetical protein
LIKLDLPDQLLAEWFTKSFVNKISRDIAMGGVVTEEQVISRAQYLDLVYSQTGTLYDLLPDEPRPSTTASSTTHATSHATDGVIGTFHAQPQSTQASPTNPKYNASNVQNDPTPTPSIESKPLRLTMFNLPLPKRINIKKGRVRTRRIKINCNMRKPKHNLLMIRINVNRDTLALSVVRITT